MNRDGTRTWTGPRGQWQDAHGSVTYALRLPTWRQRRAVAGLMRDYRAGLCPCGCGKRPMVRL